METSTFDMIELSISDFTEIIKQQLESENYQPVLGLGKAGVGKTVAVHELAKELGIGYKEFRLVGRSETDMLGTPYIDENKRTQYASVSDFPDAKRDGEEGLLVFDELTTASSNLQAIAFQLLDSSRAIGNYKLPPKWKIIGLGNGPDDGGVFNAASNALLSRFHGGCHIEPDIDAWVKWAVSNDINPTIISYIKFDPEYFYKYNADEIASMMPCPRTWEMFSNTLNAREKHCNGIVNERDVRINASFILGKTTGSRFAAFYKFKEKQISIEDILNGNIEMSSCSNLEKQSMLIALGNLTAALKQKVEKYEIPNGDVNVLKQISNTFNWLIGLSTVAQKDYTITGIQDMLTNIPQLGKIVLADPKFDEFCPAFLQFAEQNKLIFQN